MRMSSGIKYLVKYKLKDDYVDPSGWGDFGYSNNTADALARYANDRSFSKQSVIVSSKSEAWEFVAAKLEKSVSHVRKNYELRVRRAPYQGPNGVGTWVPNGEFYNYHSF